MNKAIVMEVTKQDVILMTDNGQFVKQRRRNKAYRVGEEITYHEAATNGRTNQFRWAALGASAAAILLFVFMFPSFWQPVEAKTEYYVSMDINPSLELGLDSDDHVVEIRGLNAEGEAIAEQIDVEENLSAEEAAAEIVLLAQPYIEKFAAEGEADILITTSAAGEESELDEAAVQVMLSQAVDAALEQLQSDEARLSEKVKVVVVGVPTELHEEAVRQQVSSGKLYAGLLKARLEGESPSLEVVKNTPLANIAKSVGGIEQLIDLEKSYTKEERKELMTLLQQLKKQQKHGKPSTDDQEDDMDSGDQPDDSKTSLDPKPGKSEGKGKGKGSKSEDSKSDLDDDKKTDEEDGKKDTDQNDKGSKNTNGKKPDSHPNGKEDKNKQKEDNKGKNRSEESIEEDSDEDAVNVELDGTAVPLSDDKPAQDVEQEDRANTSNSNEEEDDDADDSDEKSEKSDKKEKTGKSENQGKKDKEQGNHK